MPKQNPDLATLWQTRIESWKSSGNSKVRWCQDNNLSYHQFHYWFRRLHSIKKERCTDSFTELQEEQAEELGVCVEYAGASIKLAPQFHEDTFVRCLQALRRTL